jgi:GNAT superfamily N-acetyltransferase
MIRRPHTHEIHLLPQIESEADRRYARVGLSLVVGMPTASIAALERGRRHGLLWLAVSPLNRPVGFALMKLHGDIAWLDQLSVLDRWQGRGLGTALIARTVATARSLGFERLYLSTYRNVAWNAPFYARRGFEEVPRGAFPKVCRAIFLNEYIHGHPPWRRTIMRRDT